MIQDKIEVSPLVPIPRYDSIPLPYTDIVRESGGKEVKRVRFYLGSEEGIVISNNG